MICAFRTFASRFARLDYYTTSSRVCQEVFEKFFDFFQNFFQPLFSSVRKCSTIISHLFLFVKRFFKSFFNFFRDFSSRCLPERSSRGQLAYYSTSSSFCQHLFAKFFRFGEESTYTQIKGTVFVHHALFQRVYSFNPAQKPFRPAVFPWGSKQWKATTRLRFRSAQTP